VSSSTIKREVDRLAKPGFVQGPGLNQENHVHKVSHAGIRRTLSWRSVGMKFFGKLLLARDQVLRWARNTGKTQPVAPFHDFERLYHGVAYSNV
jgi:hypothetical protein